MELTSPPLNKEKQPILDQFDINSSHIGLYQQLYVPQFNAPNPNMVELEKLYKRYPKQSKPLFILNIVLLMILLFNISHKFNSLSWSFDHDCGPNAVFLSFGVIASLLWLGNSFILAYALAKKIEFAFRVYLFIMGLQIGLVGLGTLLRVFWAFEKEIGENCRFLGGEAFLIGFNVVLEMVLIMIFTVSAMNLKKVLSNIQILREKILTPIVYELN